jgi:hypothetical protein
VKKPDRKKQRQRPKAPELPGRPPGSKGGHVQHAIEGCGCIQCFVHRRLDRQATRMAADTKRHPPPGWTPGPTRFADTAGDELRRLLGD